MKQPGRNDPCPCGSGLKYKKCCIETDAARAASASLPSRRSDPGSRGPAAAIGERLLERKEKVAFRTRGSRPLGSPKEILDSYERIAAKVAALPPPPPGHVRVFRGQTRDFGVMLASGLRGDGSPRDAVFRAYTHALAQNMMSALGVEGRSTTSEIWRLWAQAISQHYGPGSEFLDVTHSLNVALWFALHKSKTQDILNVTGQQGPFDPVADIVSRETWTGYVKSDEANGWLYVFDVPKWSGGAHPKHGELIDLGEAPAVFASSARIRAQSACLIHGARAIDEGDLSAFYKCEPIAVAMTAIECEGPKLSIEALFPPPCEDDWYARFLALPYAPRMDGRGRLKYDHALEVSHYLYDQAEPREDVRRRLIAIVPHFAFPTAIEMLSERADLNMNYSIKNATPIVLESPLSAVLPFGHSNMWNHMVLAADIDDSVKFFDAEGEARGYVDLRNVFIEFSLLEKIGWEKLETPRQRTEVLRGVWMTKEGQEFTLHLVYHNFEVKSEAKEVVWPPRVEQGIRIVGPFICEVDQETRRFKFVTARANAPENLLEALERPLFCTLMVLRELSDNMKVSAIPMLTHKKRDGSHAFVVTFRDAAARLVKLHDAVAGSGWCFVKTRKSNEAFFKPEELVGGFAFDSRVDWPDCDKNELDRRMAEEIDKAKSSLGLK